MKGNILNNYPGKIDGKYIPDGILNPDNTMVLTDANHYNIYIGNTKGDKLKEIPAIKNINYGKIDRSAKKVIWIE